MEAFLIEDDAISQKVYLYNQPTKPKAVIHLVHGLFDYAQRYHKVAKYFEDAGFIVVVHDLPGHGELQVEPGLIDFEGMHTLVQSVYAVKQFINRKYVSIKHILIAHQLGSMIAQILMQKERNLYDQVFLLAPNSTSKTQMNYWRLIGRVISVFKPRVAPSNFLSYHTLDKPYRMMRKNGIVNEKHEWLTSDKDIQKAYLTDPKIGLAISLRAHLAVLALYAEAKRYSRLKKQASSMPLHFFCGDQDAYSDYGNYVKKLYAIYYKKGFTNLHYSVYQDARHELLNEVQRYKICDDIIHYIQKKLFK